MKGQIIKNISNTYTVNVDDTLYECVPRGKFRFDKVTPLVGDFCIIDPENNYILDLLPRRNVLNRPAICNVDVGLIIASVKKPDLDLYLLDKLISNIILAKITPVIVFTKLDLLNKEELINFSEIIGYYNKIGIRAFINTNVDDIKKYLSGKLVVLTGQTGAGKSTLLNKFDLNINQLTSPISESLGRGVHTTRHTELFPIDDFYVADTPGFSSLDLSVYTKEEIKHSFLEFNQYDCLYSDCAHLKEQDCGVKEAVNSGLIRESRYKNYELMINENHYKSY